MGAVTVDACSGAPWPLAIPGGNDGRRISPLAKFEDEVAFVDLENDLRLASFPIVPPRVLP
jgi:hypothetical protein